MVNGRVAAICICRAAGSPMRIVKEAEAIAGLGLQGDRYAAGRGSFNNGMPGKRQVTLVNGIFFKNSGFGYADSRRNIITFGVELARLIGEEFQIGGVRLRGIKYCTPCMRPSDLKGKGNFKTAFYDRGGIIAEILEGGIIKVNDFVVPPYKNH